MRIESIACPESAMDIERHQRIKAIAETALELPHGERTAHVVASCAGDAALHADVMSLLDATQVAEARDFLATATAHSKVPENILSMLSGVAS